MATLPNERSLVKRTTLERKSDYRNVNLEIIQSSVREGKKKKGGGLPRIPTSSDSEDEPGNILLDLQEILDAVLPPKEVAVEGVLWLAPASPNPATRVDVLHLQVPDRLQALGEWEVENETERLLEDRKAKDFGLCPVRRHIYDELFDELLREVTIECAERGLLLMRVRDEIRLTMATYQNLYESAIAFGIRKALNSEQRKSEAELKAEMLAEERKTLRDKVAGLERELRQQRGSLEQENVALHDRLSKDNDRLRTANAQLQAPALPQPPAPTIWDCRSRSWSCLSGSSYPLVAYVWIEHGGDGSPWTSYDAALSAHCEIGLSEEEESESECEDSHLRSCQRWSFLQELCSELLPFGFVMSIVGMGAVAVGYKLADFV